MIDYMFSLSCLYHISRCIRNHLTHCSEVEESLNFLSSFATASINAVSERLAVLFNW